MEAVWMKMTEYFQGDPKRVQHFLKVYLFANWIGKEEGISSERLRILQGAACVHDIGIREGERLYGRNDGEIQEALGPEEADRLLASLGWDEKSRQRIAWLVGHHHHYEEIEDEDLQILIEADMLVNAWEDNLGPTACARVYDRMMKTKTGRKIWQLLYGSTMDKDTKGPSEQTKKEIRSLMEKRRVMRKDWDRF